MLVRTETFRRFAGAAWTPASFPSLSGWWDATDLAGQSDGTDVTAWNDKSGNSRNWGQFGSGNYPDKETLGGYPTVDFLESNTEGMDGSFNLGDIIGSTGLVGIVFELNGNPSITNINFYNQNPILLDEASSGGGWWGVTAATISGTPRVSFSIYDTATKTIPFNISTGTRYLLVGYRTSGSVLTASLDGGAESTLSSVGAPGNLTKLMGIGAGVIPTYFNGRIYEIVTSTANGTSGDRTNLINYLKTKWGIT